MHQYRKKNFLGGTRLKIVQFCPDDNILRRQNQNFCRVASGQAARKQHRGLSIWRHGAVPNRVAIAQDVSFLLPRSPLGCTINCLVCSRPLNNSVRFRHSESSIYANTTDCGSRVFQRSTANFPFARAVLSVNVGTIDDIMIAEPLDASRGIVQADLRSAIFGKSTSTSAVLLK